MPDTTRQTPRHDAGDGHHIAAPPPPPRRRGRSALLIVVLVAVVAAVVVTLAMVRRHGTPPRPAGRNGPAQGPIRVLAAKAETQDVPVYLTGVGTVQAYNTVTVRAQIDGRLIAVPFKEGQEVHPGEVLARIDPATYQAQYDEAVAKRAQDAATLANAKLDLVRYENLAKSNYGSRQQADTQRATVAQDQAQLEYDDAAIANAKAELGYTTITSPIEGRTGIRNVDVGNIVHSSDTTGIVTVTQLQPISVVFTLPQQDLPQLNDAMKAAALPVDALAADGKVLDSGTLTVIDNQVDQTTGTVKLKATFPNQVSHLWPGQFVNARLRIAVRKGAVVVPTAAVQMGPDGAYVFVVGADTVIHQRAITVAQQGDTIAVVSKGLQAGDTVVTTGFARMTDGSKVVIGSAGNGTGAGTGQAPAAAPAGTAPANAGKGQRRRQP